MNIHFDYIDLIIGFFRTDNELRSATTKGLDQLIHAAPKAYGGEQQLQSLGDVFGLADARFQSESSATASRARRVKFNFVVERCHIV